MIQPTDQVQLGKTALRVTRLGLGTAPIGNLLRPVPEADAEAAIERAWSVGLRFFDTAPLYGHGLAEQRLGRGLRTKPRDQFVIATKVGRVLSRHAPPDPGQYYVETPPENPAFDFSYDAVMRSVESSLRRLGLDRIDILHIHDPDDHYAEALNGAYRALDKLRAEKVIGAVGAGMNQAEMLARFARDADFDCFLVAGRYTVLDQAATPELLPLCIANNIAIIIGGVYNSGILVDPDGPHATFNYRPPDDFWLTKARRINAICQRHGVPLAAAAIQFPFAHPAIATVLTGVRSAAELDHNLAMLAWPIPAALWQELADERQASD